MVGLGDRHGENVLIHVDSGECVHVDFDCLFDKVRGIRWRASKCPRSSMAWLGLGGIQFSTGKGRGPVGDGKISRGARVDHLGVASANFTSLLGVSSGLSPPRALFYVGHLRIPAIRLLWEAMY